jgi:hypothetical protein
VRKRSLGAGVRFEGRRVRALEVLLFLFLDVGAVRFGRDGPMGDFDMVVCSPSFGPSCAGAHTQRLETEAGDGAASRITDGLGWLLGRGTQVELGELRRVKQGVTCADRKRQKPSPATTDASGRCRHAQDTGHDGHQRKAGRRHSGCRIALATGGVGTVH